MRTHILFLYNPIPIRKFFVMIGLLFSITSFAQSPGLYNKLSPNLLTKLNKLEAGKKVNLVITINGTEIPSILKQYVPTSKKIHSIASISFFELNVSANELNSLLKSCPEIVFVEDGTRKPKEELQVQNLDLSLNKINMVHRYFPQWNGNGVTISIKENKPDTTDIDFKGRFLSTNLSSVTVSTHASIMATMISGAGNSWHLGKGAAWGSRISSSDFSSLLPDDAASYQQYAISVQNHSYGVGIENYYGSDAAAYDASAISNPSLLHIFSSGNSGTSTSSNGIYTGIAGLANLTGSFKMAKNILTVGATDSFNVIANLSSKGPAYDGRVKPELVAFGEDGSSGAAALVSGVSLLLQQQYKQLNGVLPANSLVKAILLNSADDAGNAGIDYSSGYGSLHALNAIKTFQAGRFISGSVANSGIQTFSISIPSGIKKVKATLVWTDPPATPNASKALVNDLDMELINTGTGETWKPWVLNSFPHIDSLKLPATRKRDSLNNTEQITIDNPLAGNYQIKVIGYNVAGSSQNFHIAYQFDSIDIFDWNYPTRNDFIFSANRNTIRWSSSFNTGTGVLEYTTDYGANWQLINNSINLSAGFYQWPAPSIIKEAMFRMSVGTIQFLSDTFTISQRTITGVGFNCPDSFLIYWNKLQSTNTYKIYKLGDKFLQPLISTTDSFVVLVKNLNPSLHYALAPVIGNSEGMKSYTFNYTTQGVECYIRAFLASLQNNTAELLLSLGTLYNINKVILEKYDGKNFVSIQELNAFSNLQINFTDASLKKGLNIYRVKLELTGGKTIYSSAETIYYFSGSDFIVFPNPVRQNQPLSILTDDSFIPVTLQVMNIYGQKLFELTINDYLKIMQPGKLSKGIYLFRFLKEGEKERIIKVFIQ